MLLLALALPGLLLMASWMRSWFALSRMPEVGDSRLLACWRMGGPVARLGPASLNAALPDTLYFSQELGLSGASTLPRDFDERWLSGVGSFWLCPAVVDFKDGRVVRVYVGKP